MKNKLLFYNAGGMKSFSLDSLTAEQYHEIFRDGYYPANEDAYALASGVATLYACVDRRAKAVESMPFVVNNAETGEALDETEIDVELIKQNVRQQLYNIEASLCIWAAAYLMIESNRIGVDSLRQIPSPQIVDIVRDPVNGITGFKRAMNGGLRLIPADKVAYIWRDSITDDLCPAQPPIHAAISAAAVVSGINKTVANIYKSGLLKAFIISVGQNPPPNAEDMKRLEETFTQRILGGIKTIFKPIAVRADVKPEIISSDLKDSYPVDMINSANDEIMRVMGVPKSLVESSALAGGTADSERLNFYDFTVIPDWQVIADDLNEQYYIPRGVMIEATPKKLPVYKSALAAQAVTVTSLTGGKPILTVDEARELIGYDPSPELAQQEQQRQEQQRAQLEQAQQAQGDQHPAGQSDQRVAQERDQLKRYAHNRLTDGKPWKFASDILPASDIETVRACKSHADIDAVTFAPRDIGLDVLAALQEAIAEAKRLAHE